MREPDGSRVMGAVLVVALVVMVVVAMWKVASTNGADTTTTQTATEPLTVTVPDPRVPRLKRRLQLERARLRRRWRPTALYAIRMAAAATGVPQWQMLNVARCESGLDVYAVNGRYRGLFQLGWRPFGMDPYDPVANAVSAAVTVRRDGGWRQWTCKP